MIPVFINDLEQDSTISRILKEENWSYSLIRLQCAGGSSMTLTTKVTKTLHNFRELKFSRMSIWCRRIHNELGSVRDE